MHHDGDNIPLCAEMSDGIWPMDVNMIKAGGHHKHQEILSPKEGDWYDDGMSLQSTTCCFFQKQVHKLYPQSKKFLRKSVKKRYKH